MLLKQYIGCFKTDLRSHEVFNIAQDHLNFKQYYYKKGYNDSKVIYKDFRSGMLGISSIQGSNFFVVMSQDTCMME